MSKDLIKVEISDELVVEVQPNLEHEWLLSTADVAEGYGLSISGVQKVKDRYLEELEEGKHWVLGQTVSKLGGRPTTMWTKKGVIRLGFLIKTPLAKQFRDWAEDFIIKKSDEEKAISIPKTYIEALQAHLESVKQLEEANRVITLQAPKVEIYDSLISTDDLVYPEKAFLYMCI